MSDDHFPIGPDRARVVLLPFTPGGGVDQDAPAAGTRVQHIVDRLLTLGKDVMAQQSAEVTQSFSDRHPNLVERIEARATEVGGPELTAEQRRLVGAYFLMEYTFECAALFNPSMVAHPDQSGTPAGGLRFVVSLRAVGEGHISSLTFRSGNVSAAGEVTLDPITGLAALPNQIRRCSEHGLDSLEIGFDPRQELSERVIFPMTEAQAGGIEDARFVAFSDGDEQCYYATYTAYSGHDIRSELIETTDFITFRLTTLRGVSARNKGMVLFPRKLGGRYAMISREDAENLYFVTSDDLRTWDGGTVILKPEFAWELIQIGNCGSPIELDEGWLLFIHGVGAIRQYAIGAVLLEKTDPTRVLARSREPLLRPAALDRGGYVPNVVYSCGGLRHGDSIILPYGVSDMFANVTILRIDALLSSLEPV